MNSITVMEHPIVIFPTSPKLQTLVDDKTTKMPLTIAKVLTPLDRELGNLAVIHPTDNDPVLVSDKLGAVAMWFDF